MSKKLNMNRQYAYTELFMRHRNMLWGLCWKRSGGNRDRCCDLLQEVSIALWEHFDKLRSDCTPAEERAWVYWQARSVFYQMGRRKEPALEPFSEKLSNTITEEDTLHRKELLEELLATLTPDEQRMLRLYLEGYQGDEIGKEMCISRDNFYQRMHRAILKMRSVALVLLTLLIASGVAIAVVPQWRHLIFGGEEIDETVIDTLPKRAMEAPEILPVDDTVVSVSRASRTYHPVVAPLEPMSPMDINGLSDDPSEWPLPEAHDKLTISVNGNRLIITGADGEMIRVYDKGGHLVASQQASGFCIMDLFSSNDPLPGNWNYKFKLKIGNRPEMQLHL